VQDSILLYTRTLSINGDIFRFALLKSETDGPSFGDLAEVRDEHDGREVLPWSLRRARLEPFLPCGGSAHVLVTLPRTTRALAPKQGRS